MSEKNSFGPKIQVFDKKIDVLFVIGLVLVLSGFVFYFLGGWQNNIVKTDVEKKIAERIKASESVSTKEQAIESISSISQELENARGSISSINEGLDGKNVDSGPSGLVVGFGETLGLSISLIGIIVLVFQFLTRSKQNQ